MSHDLDGRKTRNTELFKKVHEKLSEAGVDRNVEQIRNRWKTLKAGYYKAKQHNSKSGYDPNNFPFFEPMDEIMGGRPLANIAGNGVDVGFEEESCDGETVCKIAVPIECRGTCKHQIGIDRLHVNSSPESFNRNDYNLNEKKVCM